MFVDRSVRYLSSLGGISTSRVLNLAACAAGSGSGKKKPRDLIESPVIRRAILVKHRVRAHEEFLFGYRLDTATKIIVPADPGDLSRGGESFFVDQRGFKGKLQEIGGYPNGGIDDDSEVLHRIAELPSLDRFLVRGHLRICGVDVPPGCLELPAAERADLEEFAASELTRFVRVVLGAETVANDPVTSRLLRALFVDDVGSGLEPFRAVLRLEPRAFARAIFAWRGFLYCKWQMQDARRQIPEVLAGLQQMRAAGAEGDSLGKISQAKAAVAERILVALKRIRQLLQRYQSAYADFVDNGRPAPFRAFLVEAPHLFPGLAEGTGAISHILTFWGCRFPGGIIGPIESDELCAILQDFESGFALPSYHACSAATA